MAADFALKAAVVRNEIAGVLRSDRMSLLGAIEAHVFKLEGGQWIEMSPGEPILVHLVRDNLEGVAKMLSVHIHQLIVDNVPVSSNFNAFTLSKKFVQFVSNKFDRNCDNFGFGFKENHEVETFLQLLNHIKQMAMAGLTPMLLGSDMSPYMNLGGTVPPGISVPCGFNTSPMKSNHQQHFHSYTNSRMYELDEPLSPVMSDGAQSVFMSEEACPENEPQPILSMSDTRNVEHNYAKYVNADRCLSAVSSPAKSVVLPRSASLYSSQGRTSMETFGACGDISMAERRLSDLIASFDIAGQQPLQCDSSQPATYASSIGTPHKRG